MSSLLRNLGWKSYGLYGLGNIIGAGIYVLIGEVAREAGYGLIWSFIVAGVVAGFTALSYAALAKKYPLSAGEVVYAERAFHVRSLSLVIGMTLAFSGIVSAGVLLNSFANFFIELLSVPRVIVISGLMVTMAAIAVAGIRQTARVAVAITIAEVVGLLIVVAAAMASAGFVERSQQVFASSFNISLLPVLFGGFLAFYAFIGFEDMVNVAEEVKSPDRNIKRGMFFAVSLAIVLYILVGIAALATVPPSVLAEAPAPLATVFQTATGVTFPVITIIGLFAIVNGVLAQIVMSSRVLYGLSRQTLLPAWFGIVSSKTKTPINSTVLVVGLMLIAALSLPLAVLASMTSFALLVIFSIVHAACFKLNKQLDVSKAIPVTGLILNTLIILVQVFQWI